MKKYFLFVILFLFTTLSVNAQLYRGTLLIGGQGSFNGGVSNNLRNYNLFLNPNVGIFVAPKFAIGSSVGLQLSGQQFSSGTNNKYSYGGVYISPFARYYFLKKENKFNIFGQVNIGMGTAWTKNLPNDSQSRFQFIPGLTAGAVYFIRPQIALELAIVANFDSNVSVYSPLNQLRGVIGFQIHLNRKQKTAVVAE